MRSNRIENSIQFGAGRPKFSDGSAAFFYSIFDLEPGHRSIPSNQPKFGLLNLYSNLLRGNYRLRWRACAEAIAEHMKDCEIFRCPRFAEGKKSDREIKS